MNPSSPSFVRLTSSLNHVSEILNDLGMTIEDLENTSQRLNDLSSMLSICQQLSKVHQELNSQTTLQESVEILLKNRSVLGSFEDCELVSQLRLKYEDTKLDTLRKIEEVWQDLVQFKEGILVQNHSNIANEEISLVQCKGFFESLSVRKQSVLASQLIAFLDKSRGKKVVRINQPDCFRLELIGENSECLENLSEFVLFVRDTNIIDDLGCLNILERSKEEVQRWISHCIGNEQLKYSVLKRTEEFEDLIGANCELSSLVKQSESAYMENKITTLLSDARRMILSENIHYTDISSFLSSIVEESCYLPKSMKFELLSQIRNIILLYISLKRTSLGKKVLNPYEGSLFYASNIHLSEYLESMECNIEVSDLASLLRRDGESVLGDMLRAQQKEVLSFVNFIKLEDIEAKLLFYKTKYEQSMQKIYEIGSIWEDQLSTEECRRLLGKLSDSLISDLISKIFNMQDICTQDCEAIPKLLSKVSELVEVFEESQYCRSWSKLDLIRTILESDISSILSMNSQGMFKDKLSYYEVRHLITAMYEEGEARLSAIRALENS